MNAVHPVAPEELMAYLDGEVPAAQTRDIEDHLAGCGPCRAIVSELREGSARMRGWQVEKPPPSLVAPPSRRPLVPGRSVGAPWRLHARAWASRPTLLAGAAAVALIVAIPLFRSPSKQMIALSGTAAESVDRLSPASPVTRPQRVGGTLAAQAAPVQIESGARIVRTATLRLVAREFDGIRRAVDRILEKAGGFTGALTASANPGAPRSIRGTLRIPSSRFDAALAELRALGRVVEESHNAEDVTATVADLDVRLSNARVTERRLNEVLRNRTGSVADVLEVEREIARVRTEIEQMEAQRQQLDRRIEYATLTLEIAEERAAAVNLGPVPIPTRLRHAIADGIQTAATSMLDVALLLLRRGPVLLLWAAILGPPLWLIVRRRSA